MPDVGYYAVLQYLGRGFAGWQRQASDRTVQGEFERVLERLAGQAVVSNAAGRTDAGVHALAQVVSFRMPSRWEPEQLHRALNALLPDDVWVARVAPSPDDFHARRTAIARRYRYVIGCDAAAFSPFRRPYEWALGQPLDLPALRAASGLILGDHDFRAFSAVGQDKPHYRCNVAVARWDAREDGKGFIFSIEADRFLHRMVRFLVGTMVDVGRQRRPVEDIMTLFAQADNADASPPAPPEGLYLAGVRYPDFEAGS